MTVSERHTSILAGFIGNVIEWYDFALYGYMAGILSELFFPGENTTASLIATYGVFAAGFIMRPLGSAVFGWMGDTVGRSRTMFISVIMMVLPTFILGCLPTFKSVGIWAPVMLVLVRLVQGLSVGGEFSSSVTYLVETAPRSGRGLAGSWANTGSMLGMLLGSAAAAATTSLLPEETVHQWAWRLPFFFGGALGSVAIFMRRKLPQSTHFKRHHKQRPETSPLVQLVTEDRARTLKAVLFASAYGVLFYIPLVYLPEWLHRETGMALSMALRINTVATIILLALIPVSGWLGDRVFRRTHLLAGAMLVMAVVAWPLYHWMAVGGMYAAIVTQVVLLVIIAVPLGSAPAMFVELFPAEDRLSGYSVSYNLGLGVVGGITPMMATWIIEVTGVASAPAVLLTTLALLAFGTLLTITDNSRGSLDE